MGDLKDILSSPNFGGASVTIPLKRDIMGYVDRLTEAATVIGAVNTLVPTESVERGVRHGRAGGRVKVGD